MKKEIADNTEKLIAEGKLLKAIEFLKERTLKLDEVQKELSLLTSRLKNLNKQERLGLISDIDLRVNINRITYSLLDIIYEFKGDKKKITAESALIDRAKFVRAEQDLKKEIEKFKSGISSIFQVEEIIKEIFQNFPNRFKEYAAETGLDLIYLPSPRSEFDSILNFEGKGSIYIKWCRRFSNSLNEAVLSFILFDRPQTFNGRAPFKEYEPRQIKRISFIPTINSKAEIGWENKVYTYLSSDDLYNILYELLLIRLER